MEGVYIVDSFAGEAASCKGREGSASTAASPAERCPTAAWDMQKFWYNVTKAGEVDYGGCNGNGSG